MAACNKKVYLKPEIRTEAIVVGVYGDYGNAGGGDDHDGHQGGGHWQPVHFFNPLFHWCCS